MPDLTPLDLEELKRRLRFAEPFHRQDGELTDYDLLDAGLAHKAADTIETLINQIAEQQAEIEILLHTPKPVDPDLAAVNADLERQIEGMRAALGLACEIFDDMTKNGHIFTPPDGDTSPAPFGTYYVGSGVWEKLRQAQALSTEDRRGG